MKENVTGMEPGFASRTEGKIDFEQNTIKNDVMFSSVFRNPEDCREILQRILGMEISEIAIDAL